jgi:hypothetical protein
MIRPPCSEQCSLASLDLFTVPPTQTAIESGIWDTVRSHPQFSENTTILFDIPADSQKYISLNQTELWLTCRLIKKTPGMPAADAIFVDLLKPENVCDISTVNNLIHSLFKQVEISLNGKECENQNGNYSYKAMIGLFHLF